LKTSRRVEIEGGTVGTGAGGAVSEGAGGGEEVVGAGVDMGGGK